MQIKNEFKCFLLKLLQQICTQTLVDENITEKCFFNSGQSETPDA